jgi:hypothetical protein
MHGIVQRLVQKEKAAVRLQAELDRLRSENTKLLEASVSRHAPSTSLSFIRPKRLQEEQERIKRERDRAKWSAMTEEMSNSKAKVSLKAHILTSILQVYPPGA